MVLICGVTLDSTQRSIGNALHCWVLGGIGVARSLLICLSFYSLKCMSPSGVVDGEKNAIQMDCAFRREMHFPTHFLYRMQAANFQMHTNFSVLTSSAGRIRHRNDFVRAFLAGHSYHERS